MIVRLKRGGTLLHLLRTPIRSTHDQAKAESSRLAWTVDLEEVPEWVAAGPVPVFSLTVLGVLHGLFGLTVETK